MLIAVGLGPGDPDLLTHRATDVLGECEVVYVPGDRAAHLVEPYNSNTKIVRAPMTENQKTLGKFWSEVADEIGPLARENNVGFGVIGDPCFFSTFNYLRQAVEAGYPEVDVEIVPGVSIITAFASKTGECITSSFVVTDGSPVNAKVMLKANNPRELAEEARGEGFTRFTVLENLFTDQERISEELSGETSYFTLLFARREE